MALVILLIAIHLLMVASGALFGNPLAFIGAGYLGFCLYLAGCMVARCVGLY